MKKTNAQNISDIRRAAGLARFANGAPPKGERVSIYCPKASADALREWAKANRVAPTLAIQYAISDFLAKK